MADPVRLDVVAHAHTVVIKVGTNVLADSTGRLDRHRIQSLADQIHRIRESGRKVVLVTSGAIGAGVGKLGLGKRPTDLAHLQACAAVGQTALMQLYQESLAQYGIHTAQILLTAERLRQPRPLSERPQHDLSRCSSTVRCRSSTRTTRCRSRRSSSATTTTSPRWSPTSFAPRCSCCSPTWTASIPTTRAPTQTRNFSRRCRTSTIRDGLAAATKSTLGTGGMESKLKAARLATAAGEAVIMANGSLDGILDRVFAGGAGRHAVPAARGRCPVVEAVVRLHRATERQLCGSMRVRGKPSSTGKASSRSA